MFWSNLFILSTSSSNQLKFSNIQENIIITFNFSGHKGERGDDGRKGPTGDAPDSLIG